MSTRDKIAFIIYFIGVLSLIVFGLLYLFCPTVMPYHLEAMGVPWEDLGKELQILLWALVKVAGAGFFVVGLSALIILLIPFRRGDKWAHWALPLIGIVWNAILLYAAGTVAAETQASPPWIGSAVGIISVIIAFMLSPGFGKNH